MKPVNDLGPLEVDHRTERLPVALLLAQRSVPMSSYLQRPRHRSADVA
jgi:hypothetical protein